jgi:thiosulfate/3-mercaptopyruvate sulfurtransferase
MNQNYFLIEADELMRRIGDENLRIYDASVNDIAYRQEHIPGAAYFDHNRFSVPDSIYMCTILPENELIAEIGNIGIANDSEVVIYACGMLPYAARAWWVLRYAGHKNIRVLNGGMDAWKKAGGMIEPDPRQYPPTVFQGQPDPGMFASKEEVFASMEDPDVAIVDVLPQVSYEAAHIPGSICNSCLDLMNTMDYFIPVDQLAVRLNAVPKQKRIITYCGGGIAAAVNAMAHIMVGHKNIAVYDGSLYEWLGEGYPMVGTGEWEVWKMQ